MSSRALRLVLAVVLVPWSSLAGSGTARAATLIVTDPGDTGSPGQLRTLMNGAAPGDTILVPAGTVILSGAVGEDLNAGGDLDVRKDLTIEGAGAGTTIIDGGARDGVFDVLNPNHLTLSGVTIRNGAREANVGSPQAGGGGIRNFGTLDLAHAVVSGNQAVGRNAGDLHFGGGIRNLGTLTVTDVTIVGNHARGSGGGIYNELGAVMTLTDVTVSGNTVEIDGAGVSNLGTATLTNVTVNGNNADQNGGGIFNAGAVVSAATTTLTNVTLSGNHAVGLGGGMYNSATAILTNVTVSGNSTANLASGGGVWNFRVASLENVLLAGNTSGGVEGDCSGAVTSLGHNLDGGTTCALTGSGDLSGTAPNLGPLQDNGGLTFTHALQAGSPAIDAGANAGCPSTDQRGAPRPQGPFCDIGAYEASSAAPTPILEILPATLVDGTVGTAYSQALTLAVGNGVPYTPPSPTLAVAAGSLPPGLTLGSSTGLLEGTPTSDGSFAFTVSATDSNGLGASRQYAITIRPAVGPPSGGGSRHAGCGSGGGGSLLSVALAVLALWASTRGCLGLPPKGACHASGARLADGADPGMPHPLSASAARDFRSGRGSKTLTR